MYPMTTHPIRFSIIRFTNKNFIRYFTIQSSILLILRPKSFDDSTILPILRFHDFVVSVVFVSMVCVFSGYKQLYNRKNRRIKISVIGTAE